MKKTTSFSKHTALSQEKLESLVTHILEEGRMVLPGIQALLGFQLIAVFNESFKTHLSTVNQYCHLAAIFFSLISICFLMTPAALHRLGEPDGISTDFATLASKLIAIGMIPLLFSFCLDFYIVSYLVSANQLISLSITFFIASTFIYCWFIMPLVHKNGHRTIF